MPEAIPGKMMRQSPRALGAIPLSLAALALSLAVPAAAQTKNCVAPSGQKLIIYRAGSLTAAFKPLIDAFTCQTGIQVKDEPMGSVDAGRQITAGGQPCDLYAPADYLDIDLFMKPAGYADFDIVFAHDRMVLAYSAKALAAKKLPRIAESGSFEPPRSIPKAVSNWYEILTRQGVVIRGGNPFLDPGAYRAPMIFQLAAEYYKVPNLYNNLLEHLMIPAQGTTATLGKDFDFQFIYEHSARAAAAGNPDYRYVDLPDTINLSDPAKDDDYRKAVVVLPGLGTSRSERNIPVPAARVAWGIALMKNAPNRANAIRFLQLLLSPAGAASLNKNGPAAIAPALVSPADFKNLPDPLKMLVRRTGK
ncbi:MAG TPA: extracellular solute-binding protein [Bryobacteraceae bacterium]|nr:extracellular solute-binding protein [Bryobacteraceae bacterium]